MKMEAEDNKVVEQNWIVNGEKVYCFLARGTLVKMNVQFREATFPQEITHTATCQQLIV